MGLGGVEECGTAEKAERGLSLSVGWWWVERPGCGEAGEEFSLLEPPDSSYDGGESNTSARRFVLEQSAATAGDDSVSTSRRCAVSNCGVRCRGLVLTMAGWVCVWLLGQAGPWLFAGLLTVGGDGVEGQLLLGGRAVGGGGGAGRALV